MSGIYDDPDFGVSEMEAESDFDITNTTNMQSFISNGFCEWCGATVVGDDPAELHMDWHIELNRRLADVITQGHGEVTRNRDHRH